MHGIPGQRDHAALGIAFGVHQPVEAVPDTDDLPMLVVPGERYRPNNGIKAGASPPPVDTAMRLIGRQVSATPASVVRLSALRMSIATT